MIGPRLAPAEAYAKAPSIISEIGWTARRAVQALRGATADREYWLRKAALLDRIAWNDERAHIVGDAIEAAELAAHRLTDLDGAQGVSDPRGYVRSEYARWASQH
ncbi:hypothetical protein ACIQUQ_26450 [Streptomyces sp. NPDC101118]|uniref:hypothetical protein n=1 Tax=Streptomyces sp. NPDC101118 TaxID=3366109 RepID=UPI0038030127